MVQTGPRTALDCRLADAGFNELPSPPLEQVTAGFIRRVGGSFVIVNDPFDKVQPADAWGKECICEGIADEGGRPWIRHLRIYYCVAKFTANQARPTGYARRSPRGDIKEVVKWSRSKAAHAWTPRGSWMSPKFCLQNSKTTFIVKQVGDVLALQWLTFRKQA